MYTTAALVLVTGLEPVRCCHRGILSPLRLPVPPHQRKSVLSQPRKLLIYNTPFGFLCQYFFKIKKFSCTNAFGVTPVQPNCREVIKFSITYYTQIAFFVKRLLKRLQIVHTLNDFSLLCDAHGNVKALYGMRQRTQ